MFKRYNPEVLPKIFDSLLQRYGPRKWWPAETRFEVIIGAILTQNVSWKNAKKAINNLKKEKLLSSDCLVKASHDKIARLIRSSRFYNQKTDKIKAFCRYINNKYSGSLNRMFDSDTDTLRSELLCVRGLGRETVDSILLYAGKKPSFVVDNYTKRFLERYGIITKGSSYEEIRSLFMKHFPGNVYLFNEYHALIVHHGSLVCSSRPGCDRCPVLRINNSICCRKAISR